MQAIYNELTGEWEYPDEQYGGGTTPQPQAPPQANPNAVPDGNNQWGLPVPSNNPTEPNDLSYWLQHGVTPTGNDQSIFDSNGQLRPGWQRTANGYERIAPAADPYAGYSTGDGSGGGGGYSPYTPPDRTSLSSLNYPSLNLPRFNAPPAFAYKDFAAPTAQEAEAEPGFDYALKQGVKAYENSKAYTGTYKGGATIKGINDYARNMASQNYGQVFDRSAQTYDRNRSNAADNYMTNYGVSRDTFDRNYTATKDEFAPQARSAELQYARDWDLFAYEGDDAYRRWKAQIDANT